jgi:tRNA-Thr(GGU) m(6)t(6)A37 methyltransferase TsaA
MEITKKELKSFEERILPDKICFKPIGIIHTEFKSLKGIPIQFSMSNSRGIIEIYPQFQEGLKDLEGFSHIYCIFFFDLVKLPVPLKSKPFLYDKKVGVFSMRTPFRPNPIGLSVLQILEIKQNIIKVNNVDILDNTPILDIKPYISKFDCRKTLRHGWIEGRIREMTS